jgi:hypothetical protein
MFINFSNIINIMVGKFEKIFGSIKKGIDKITQNKNEQLEYISSIRKLWNNLDEIVGKIQEMYNIREIEGYRALIGLNYPMHNYDRLNMRDRVSIIINIYSKDNKIIKCELNRPSSPDKFVCTTNYSSESLELPNSISYIQAIKDWNQEAYKLFYKEALKHKDEEYMSTTITAYRDLNELIEDNPEISKDKLKEDTYKIMYKSRPFEATIISSFW